MNSKLKIQNVKNKKKFCDKNVHRRNRENLSKKEEEKSKEREIQSTCFACNFKATPPTQYKHWPAKISIKLQKVDDVSRDGREKSKHDNWTSCLVFDHLTATTTRTKSTINNLPKDT